MASLAVSQMYSSVHQHAGVEAATSQSVAHVPLPNIHAVMHRGSLSQKSNMKSSIPVSSRGGSRSKVIHQPLNGSCSRPKSERSSRQNSDGSMTPAAATAKYRRIMTEYELTEITNYRKVWFLGPTAQKIRGTKNDANFGYDNDKCRYRAIRNDHIAYRYEVLKCLGKGSFGDVMQVYDHKEKEVAALKIIRNEPRFHEQAKEEIKILELLRERDPADRHNVIHIKDYFKFRGHLCIAFEICSNDLYAELKLGNFNGFSMDRLKAVGRELVQSLRHLRRNKIIHCDLKPENILLRRPGSSAVKVIDFGSSCFIREQIHTYIQSRFYRAPEIILGVLPYGCPIDMWSLGCIMVELYTGRPLFPGHSEREQLMCQVEYLGMPPESFLAKSERRRSFFEDGLLKKTTDRRGRLRSVHPRSLKLLLGGPTCDPDFLNFVQECLVWEPELRITPRDASRHPFLDGRISPPSPQRTMRTARRQSDPPAPPPMASLLAGGQDDIEKKPTRAASGIEATSTASPRPLQGRTAVRRQSQIFATASGVVRDSEGASKLQHIYESTMDQQQNLPNLHQ